ncbi:MAG: rod shape-determining protein [Lachnospiraceae bacterium]|nr:rod shape-determining protein [Lachnospiraceae bacterium]
MEEQKKYAGQLVFGLDIGTRSIVGTVGYKSGKQFEVVAQFIREHDTRAMMDGQIHDIHKVSESIKEVKEALEAQVGRKLTEVCIAAAGRVLRTLTIQGEIEFEEETEVNAEHIYSLDSLCVEKAHGEIGDLKEHGMKFYCVGYTVIKYYLNDYPIRALDNHKAKKIGADMLVTFLPEDVVDGLYKAVEIAGLEVATLTLEPIAAMNVAIPEMYRMLNIALVDVGAGTSDICITKDGSIIAYGMIPYAGDELTETIAREYLLDFKSADQLKIDSGSKSETISYKDIMGITHKIAPDEVLEKVAGVVDDITGKIAEKMMELNGGKPVSAVFIVGGGGKISGFAESLADKLGIMRERVALRGEEVMDDIYFWQSDIKKDPLLVTPIGICLNFYDQKNNFVYVNFNGQRIKLYDNNHLTIVDAAMQAGFPNDGLFPKRGKEIVFTVNEKQRIIRGSFGEPAVVTLDGEPASINTPIEANMQIKIEESTAGAPAEYTIEQLPEYSSTIMFMVNGKKVECPKFVQVNGELVSGYYSIKTGDEIKMLKYYTVEQLLEFMDIMLDYGVEIQVNNQPAFRDTIVYENFSIQWEMEQNIGISKLKNQEQANSSKTEDEIKQLMADAVETTVEIQEKMESQKEVVTESEKGEAIEESSEEIYPEEQYVHEIQVTVNEKLFTLSGKKKYTFIDAYDAFGFDVSTGMGKELVMLINGVNAQFISRIKDKDKIEIYWK